MPFRFTLESLLRLRRSEQRQHELFLQKANEQVSRIRREIEALENELKQIAAGMKSATEASGAEIWFDESRAQVLATHRIQADLHLQAARERQVLVAAEFQRAWQRREALETLREGERQAHVLAESRIEQRRQDDLFLQRRGKR